jgi:cytochrome c oxidase subunit IV
MTTEHAVTTDHAAVPHHSEEEINRHVKIYVTVFVALMALTVVTVAISYLDLSFPVAVALALFVATIKGALVACYFMHLMSEKKLIYAVLVITVVKFVVLLALPILTHGDSYGFFE